MKPIKTIGYLLTHLVSVMTRQSDQALQEQLGIGYSQFKILMILQNNPMVQQREIAELLGQTEASISRQIKGLVELQLLTSEVSQQNRRQRLTSLTDAGQERAQDALAVLNETHAEMFGALSEQQREELLQTLTTMHRYACQNGKTGACHHPVKE